MKKNIAIIMGGYSSEFKISLKSGNVVYNSLDKSKYNAFRIHIFKDKWVYVNAHNDEFPINKDEICEAILENKTNLKKIVDIVHLEIRKKMNLFLKKNINKKIVILDIPLLMENKINKKDDILIFVQSKKADVLKRLKKRKNFNLKLFKRFKKIQLPLEYKRRKSTHIIKNNFTENSVRVGIKNILKKIL